MFSKLLVAIDGSDNSFRALKHAIFLSKKITASNHCPPCHGISPSCLCSVTEDIKYNYLKISWGIWKYLNKSRDTGKKSGVKIETELKKGDAASNILAYSKKEGYDTIIMGRRGTGKLKQLVLGSTSTKVLNHSDCTVVIVK